jgi:2,4-dienoyl-CoA reductase-like NADH-dependent reductase (Old Yellow Enzyme family)
MTMTAGSAVVSPDSPPAFGNLHAWNDDIVPWLRAMTDEIHEHGAVAMIQITHLGRRTGWGQDDWLPVVAPSRLREPAHRNHPKEAEQWDIDRIVGEYADAAERMVAGGMDGIEIESYGHLFDQFWSPATNRRTDLYGGSVENRMRFSLEVLYAVRRRIGPDVMLGIRMAVDERLHEAGVDGFDEPAGLAMLRRVCADGLIDFVNVICGNVADEVALTEVIPIHGMASAPHLDVVGRVKGMLAETAPQVAVLHAAKVDDVATARHAVREGLVDLIGMTRAQMAEPHLVRKIQIGAEHTIRPCVGATYCLDRIYQAGEALCIHNAATGRELAMPHVIERADRSRRVVVIGAGPAGLEAARVSAERGHDVVVLEAMPWAGGQLRLAARNPRRRDLMGIIDWRVDELARLGVDVRYDTYAEPDLIASFGPDVVIVATGGLRCPPERRCAAVRRRRLAFGDDHGRDARALRCAPRDRHPRAHARYRRGWHEPRSVRAGVQRDRHTRQPQPARARGPSARGPAPGRDRQRSQPPPARRGGRRSRGRPRCAVERRAVPPAGARLGEPR